MKKYAYGISLLAVLFASAFVLAAQTGHNDPFVGTWKLDVAKSKFSPGPGPKSETVTIAPDGKVSVQDTNEEGTSVEWSFTPSGDTAVPIEGMENSTVIQKQSGNTVDHTWKMNGENSKGHGVISKNGKIMKYTMTGTNSQGEPIHDVLIFERQ